MKNKRKQIELLIQIIESETNTTLKNCDYISNFNIVSYNESIEEEVRFIKSNNMKIKISEKISDFIDTCFKEEDYILFKGIIDNKSKEHYLTPTSIQVPGKKKKIIKL